MAICLANSLVVHSNYNPYDQLVRYRWWHKKGYMSSTGECFDIGAATSQSLDEFGRRQTRFAKQHNLSPEEIDYLSNPELLKQFNVYCSEAGAAGNGALMRLAPTPLFFYRFPPYAVEYSGRSGQITHGDTKAYDACRYYGALIVAALHGYRKDQILDKKFYSKHKEWFMGKPLCNEIKLIAEGSYQKAGGYKDGIRGKGYIVGALEAALWAFWSDGDSFEKGALEAVNLGDDTDTTAAIYGQLAGAYYGYKNLPEHWLQHLYAKKFILNLSKWIVYEGDKWRPLENIFPFDPTSPTQPAPRETITEPIALKPNLNTYPAQSNPSVPIFNSAETVTYRNQLGFTSSTNIQNQPVPSMLPNANRAFLNPKYTDSHVVYQSEPVDTNTKLTLRKSNSNKQPPMIQTSTFSSNLPQHYETTLLVNDQHGPVLRGTQSVASTGSFVPTSTLTKIQISPIYDDKKSNIISGTSTYITSDKSLPRKTSSNSSSSRNPSLVVSSAFPESSPTTMPPKQSNSKPKHRLPGISGSRNRAKSPVPRPQVVSPNSNGSNLSGLPSNNNSNIKATEQFYNNQASGYQNNSPSLADQLQKTKSPSGTKNNKSNTQSSNWTSNPGGSYV
jgi:ADP-ribosylglycohydrolase